MIVVPVAVSGPSGERVVPLALDTGATSTMVSRDALTAIGYALDAASDSVDVTTASGREVAPVVLVARISVLSHQKVRFPVVAHTIPPATGVRGVLGLDFLRGMRLTIDFRIGVLELE